MRRLIDRWNRFWFAPTDPHPIAAFRIVFGSYLVIYLSHLLPHATTLFSSEGVYAPYVIGDYAASPAVAVLLFAATCVLAVMLAVGYHTRIVAPLLLTGFLYHYFLNLAVKHSSYDRLILVYLVVLCCVDAGRVWSLDARTRRPQDGSVPAWAVHILCFQTVALYFGAGLWKLAQPAWRTGHLLEAVMQGLWATPIAFWLTSHELPLQFWMLTSWVLIGFELAIGFFLFHHRMRGLALVALVLFHVANTVILFIPEFLVCLAPLVLFVPGAKLRAAARLLDPRRLALGQYARIALRPVRFQLRHR